MRPHRSFVLAPLAVLFAAHAALAQSPSGDASLDAAALQAALSAVRSAAEEAPAAARQETPEEVPFTAGWRDGFILQSADGQFSLRLGLLVQADGRFAVDDTDNAITDTFAIRRLRPSLQGRVFQRFEFNLNPDFAGGALVVQDAYIDTRFSSAFRVRVGKAKTPFGFERLASASNLLFLERALPTALVPNRDVGVQVLGDVAGGTISYAAGVLNGVTDGGSADVGGDDGKDIAGRLVVRPAARAPGSAAAGLGFALSGSRGTQRNLPAFRTPTLQQPFLTYAGTGAVGDGVRVRYSPQIFYYRGPLGAFGEFVHSAQPIRRGEVSADVAHQAWQAAASWVLIGGNASDRGVRPVTNFGDGGIGALQIAARYHTLRVDESAITLGLAAAAASRRAESFTVGLNWYLTPQVKYVLNAERTVFDGGAPGARPAEHGLAVRAQIVF